MLKIHISYFQTFKKNFFKYFGHYKGLYKVGPGGLKIFQIFSFFKQAKNVFSEVLGVNYGIFDKYSALLEDTFFQKMTQK